MVSAIHYLKEHTMSRLSRILAFILVLTLTQSSGAQWEMSEKMQKVSSDSMMLSQLIQLTHNKGLMSEMEILDDQMRKVKKIGMEYQQNMMKMTRANSDMYTRMAEVQKRVAKGDADAKKELKEITEKFYEDLNGYQTDIITRLENVLLPHQMKRLRQIAKQHSFKWTRNSDYFGMPHAMSKELGLSADQKKKLKQATDKIREKYYREIAELRKKSMEKILSNLTREQRDKFEDMVGDFYDADKTRKGTAIRPADKSRRSKDDN